MKRREFPAKVRAAAFERADGRCESCGAKLMTSAFHYDHRIPDAMGGEPVLENCEVLCKTCHFSKTAGTDAPRIAKTRRQHRKHIGAKRSSRPLPGSRASGWRHRLDGTWERRET